MPETPPKRRPRIRPSGGLLFLAGMLAVPAAAWLLHVLSVSAEPASSAPMAVVSLTATMSPYQKWLASEGVRAPARPMAFVLVPAHSPCRRDPCGMLVLGQGDITPDTPATFADFLHRVQAVQQPEGVAFDSGGGSFFASLAIGAQIRQARLATVVRRGASCQSACAYAFLGGTRRTVAPGAAYGVHVGGVVSDAPRSPPRKTFTAMDMETAAASGFRTGVGDTGLLMKYLDAMGIDAAYLAATMHSYGDTYNLSPACMAWLRVTTGTPRPRHDPCPGVTGIQAFACPSGTDAATHALHAMLGSRLRCRKPDPNAVVLR